MTLREMIDQECNRVLEEVCTRLGVRKADVRGSSTEQRLIVARRDTARTLAARGFRNSDIAIALNCHHGTVKYWTDEDTRQKRRANCAEYAKKRRGNAREFLRNMEAATAAAKNTAHHGVAGLNP